MHHAQPIAKFALTVLALLALPATTWAQHKAGIGSPSIAADAPVPSEPTALQFPRNYWDPEIRWHLLFLEFLKSGWEQRLKIEPPPADKRQILEEIQYLHSLVEQREERRDEIKAQQESSLLPYFFARLMMNQSTHPRTYELMNFGIGLGIVMFHFKEKYNRARPSQLSPDLAPIIPVPGHPAYPSAHAFQSRLVALILIEIRPDARKSLLDLSQRIALNREIAGVHYPSDSRAGQSLAEQALEIAKEGRLFQALMAEAKAEWK